MDDIAALAKEWLRLDKDQETRTEIEELISRNAHDDLEQRLGKRIAFGTAGLRARMEAGFSRMNALTVIQASQGLASYVLEQDVEASNKGIVIGYDARFNSEKFARLAAAAFLAKGLKVLWFRETVHTPLVPFAIKHFNAAAGIVVTASHNPAHDNGYKVYWSNGSQIIPPHDVGIAAAIEQNLEPISWDIKAVEAESNVGTRVIDILDAAKDSYYAALKSALLRNDTALMPQFVYTPMHGVGLKYMTEAVRLFDNGDTDEESQRFVIVPEQAQPDPTFPTVRFPNPEEKGALALAIATADKHSIDLIIANDPDADRLAVAQRMIDGTWYQFTGNELGILLATHVLEDMTEEPRNTIMLNSTVSTGMLKVLLRNNGAQYEETLTGFKWLGNKAQDLVLQGYNAPFAFEEALGYMFTGIVADKDGISAAVAFLTAVAHWQTKSGLTLWEKLQELYRRYGYFSDANTYLISPSPEITNLVFGTIRGSDKASYPSYLGSRKILRWRDLTTGFDSGTSDHLPTLPTDPGSQMITCELEGQTRFTVRGSGTEPKIKLYIESQADTESAARAEATAVQRDLIKDWFPIDIYGLKMA